MAAPGAFPQEIFRADEIGNKNPDIRNRARRPPARGQHADKEKRDEDAAHRADALKRHLPDFPEAIPPEDRETREEEISSRERVKNGKSGRDAENEKRAE